MKRIRKRARTTAAAVVAVGLTSLAVAGGAAAGQTSRTPQAPPRPVIGADGVLRFGHAARAQAKAAQTKAAPAATATPAPIPQPLPPGQCRARFGLPCYGAPQLARTYGLGGLRARGVTGRGTSVGLVMPFHDPHLTAALATYSRQFRLGTPQVAISRPYGAVKTIDPTDPAMVPAGVEEELDAEMIHTTAPGATIRIIEVPGEWGPTSDMTTAAAAAAWAARRYPLAAISMSYGWGEDNYREKGGGGLSLLHHQNTLLHQAAATGVTLLAADGDEGPTAWDLAGTGLYKHRATYFPASSANVVGVSGTELHVADNGTHTGRDTVWTDDGQGEATGGATSDVFPRPAWQPARLGARRNVGDISMVASDQTRVWLYTPYTAFADQAPGWGRVAGTSVSSPLLAGIIADAAQHAGQRLGNLDPALARLHGTRDGLLDVRAGCNTANNVTGWCAHPGIDTPSGVGTIGDAWRFITALTRR